MPSFALRYTRIRLQPSAPFPEGQVVARPQIILRLTLPDSPTGVICAAYLDTGADHCVFPLSFAHQLDLDPTKMPAASTGGVTGRGDVCYSDIRLSIPLGGRVFAFVARVGFTEGLDALGVGLLGQTGFFDKFVVAFDRAQETFTIRVREPATTAQRLD